MNIIPISIDFRYRLDDCINYLKSCGIVVRKDYFKQYLLNNFFVLYNTVVISKEDIEHSKKYKNELEMLFSNLCELYLGDKFVITLIIEL